MPRPQEGPPAGWYVSEHDGQMHWWNGEQWVLDEVPLPDPHRPASTEQRTLADGSGQKSGSEQTNTAVAALLILITLVLAIGFASPDLSGGGSGSSGGGGGGGGGGGLLGDLDCIDIGGPISVGGSDPHGLDADNDGVGCE